MLPCRRRRDFSFQSCFVMPPVRKHEKKHWRFIIIIIIIFAFKPEVWNTYVTTIAFRFFFSFFLPFFFCFSEELEHSAFESLAPLSATDTVVSQDHV